MSDLLKLEALGAPPINFEQSLKRCSELESIIDSAWAFIKFLSRLDEGMRISFFNYLHTQATDLTRGSDLSEEISAVYEPKIYSKSLSPKKTKTRKPKKTGKRP